LDTTILDEIDFQLDPEDFLKGIRLSKDDPDAAKAVHMAQEAASIARPKGLYGMAYVESKTADSVVIAGITFTSRVLRVNMEQAHRAFPYVATCGTELEKWSDSFGDMFERHWADTIKQRAVGEAARFLNGHLEKRYDPGKLATMNPGSLPDWPISQQRLLFELLGNPAASIGVRLTDSFLMVPTKSVSGIRFPAEVSFENCQLCPRENCPGRRAPYDGSLFSARYGPEAKDS